MKKKQLVILLFFISLVGIRHSIWAQQAPTNTPLKLFFEKVYIHTDREYYVAGEDLWFKAYLVNAQSNFPTYSSNNLYVDIVNEAQKVVLKSVIRMDNGLGNGDFLLPDTLSSGNYQLRAYTNWMRNFGTQFIFQRNIFITSKTPKTIANGNVQNKKLTTPATSTSSQNMEKAVFHFFPEGGNLVADMLNTIAFKAEDASGKSIPVKGEIIDATKKVVATFNSTHQGMGSFVFKPVADALYDVVVTNTNTNQPIEAELPIALNKGLVVSVNTIEDTAVALVSVKTNALTFNALKANFFLIEVKHAGKKIFTDTLYLSGEISSKKMATSLLPEGVSVITLFDAQKRPMSERLFYVDKHHQFNFNVTSNKTKYTNKEDVVINIDASFAEKPISANVSMAVVDAQFVPVSSTSIASFLHLQSEIKGTIEQANQYFDANNKNRLQQLDLLLRTQGWRTYLWIQLAQQNLSIKYLPEAGITLSGTVQKTMGGKPLSHANITVTAPDAIGVKRFAASTDSLGKFYVDGIHFSGLQRFKLASRNAKGAGYGYITLDSLFYNGLSGNALVSTIKKVDTAVAVSQFVRSAIERKTESDRLKSIAVNDILPEVIVKSSREKTVNLRDGTYMDGGFKDSVFVVDPLDMQRYGTLETYLVNKVNGVQVDAQNGGILLGSKGKRPRVIIDNREDVFERLDFYTLPMNVISKVVIKRVITIDGSMDDIFIIYLTLKPEANQQNNPDVLSTDVMGYYQARSFYAPQVKPNISTKNYLTTLYWNPSIQIINGKARVVIDSRKMNTNWRVVIEGITENGIPIHTLLNYSVE